MMQVLAAMKPALVSSDTDLTSQILKPPDDANGEVSGDGVHLVGWIGRETYETTGLAIGRDMKNP